MDAEPLTLDGNAAGGVFNEVFAAEVTAARGACAWCGSEAAVGEQHWFQHPLAPGGVLRCRSCAGALMVVVRVRGKLRLGFPGVRWLDVDAAE